MLKKHKIDFVDVVTTMETHLNIGKILSKYKIPTSMQKPFAENLSNAKKIVSLGRVTRAIRRLFYCQSAGQSAIKWEVGRLIENGKKEC